MSLMDRLIRLCSLVAFMAVFPHMEYKLSALHHMEAFRGDEIKVRECNAEL